MQRSFLACSLLACHALTACIASEDAVSDGAVEAAAKPTTIHIASPFPPALVVFRDGLYGRWQPARQISATAFEARVHGPYMVSVVCVDHPVFVDLSETLTWQVARTLDDSHDLAFCGNLPPEHTVTGHMVQPGFVQIGDNNDRSTLPEWDFSIPVPTGTFDLSATSADAITVRRGLAIDGDLAVTPPIDLTLEGTALADVAFTATNATADETTQVSVGLLTATTPFFPARVFLGPLDTAKAAPDAALIATDTQTASVRAFSFTGTSVQRNPFRALRRPFHVGGDTVFTLPPALDGVQWSVTGDELAMQWAALPAFTAFVESVGGNAAGGTTPVNYLVDLSPRFLAATQIHHFTIDTHLPGFQPAWTIDLTSFYNRDLTVQNVPAANTVLTSEITEFLDPTQPSQLAAQAHARRAPAAIERRRGPGLVDP